MNQERIGAVLKELRKERNLTQEELAEQFNVSNRTVSRWETGNNMPDISTLIELSEFYEVDLRELIRGERKSEEMKEQDKLKETAVAVADYADAEKALLLRRARMASILGLVSLMVGLVLELVATNLSTSIPVLDCCIGICWGSAIGAFVVLILYTMGTLAKVRNMKKSKPCVIWIILITSLALMTIVIVSALIRTFK